MLVKFGNDLMLPEKLSKTNCCNSNWVECGSIFIPWNFVSTIRTPEPKFTVFMSWCDKIKIQFHPSRSLNYFFLFRVFLTLHGFQSNVRFEELFLRYSLGICQLFVRHRIITSSVWINALHASFVRSLHSNVRLTSSLLYVSVIRYIRLF